MKDILIEMKNNYRESRVEWMKPRIKLMIRNTERKSIKSEQEKE